MKHLQLNKLMIAILAGLFISVITTSCTKDDMNKGSNETGKHFVDKRLVGKWMWTKGSDGAYFDNNGVYQGAAYGLAAQYIINADGYGSSYSHIYSTIGIGTYLEVNISSTGFFETDDQGHFGFFPTAGNYKSSSGENRALMSDELWNVQTNTGKSHLKQKLVFTTVGGRECFQVTASDGTVDTFYKIP